MSDADRMRGLLMRRAGITNPVAPQPVNRPPPPRVTGERKEEIVRRAIDSMTRDRIEHDARTKEQTGRAPDAERSRREAQAIAERNERRNSRG